MKRSTSLLLIVLLLGLLAGAAQLAAGEMAATSEADPEPESEPDPAATASGPATPAGRFVEIDLVVRRENGEPIALDDWLAYVEQAPELRHRTEPHIGRNPKTGEPMPIRAGDGDAELVLEEFTVGFLCFSHGTLEGRFHLDPENPLDPQRSRIAAAAKHFRALVLDRDSDQPLAW